MTNASKPGTSYRFLPVVRRGLRPVDDEFALDRPASGADALTGPPTVPVDLTVEARRKDGGWTAAKPVSKRVELYGPGDVRGIADDQIVRVEPEPGTADFPPNYFPQVEFERADLPWLFSPERTYDKNAADSKTWRARTRPWITLVVVPESEATVTGGGDGLPILEAPPTQLPPPSETWAWAHAQVVGESGGVSDVVGDEPSRTVSRLLCPRNLTGGDGETTDGRYVAAVVPTFEPGRRAGLGLDPYPAKSGSGTGNQSQNKSQANQQGQQGKSQSGGGGGATVSFAWSRDGSEAVRLPAYYLWEFQVGAQDFESLVDELTPTQLSTSEVGVRSVDVSHPGPTTLVDQSGDQVVDQVGAFESPSLSVDGYDASKRRTLRECLNRPNALTSGGNAVDEPVVGAPLYGQWHVDTDVVSDQPGWYAQLNLEPTYRIAAGLGAEVVRENQESFVSAAWDQAGQLDEVNRLMRGGQLSRAASNRIHDGLQTTAGSTDSRDRTRVLQFTQPVQGRLSASADGTEDGQRTLGREFAAAEFPESALSPAFRRLTSPRGALARNAGADVTAPGKGTGSPIDPTLIAEELVAGRTTPADLAATLDDRVVTLDDMAGRSARPTQMLSTGPADGDDPPTLLTTTVQTTAEPPQTTGRGSSGGDDVARNTPMPSSRLEGYEPDVAAARAELGVDPAAIETVSREPVGVATSSAGGDGGPPANGVDAQGAPETAAAPATLSESLRRVHRLGNWGRSLVDGDVGPERLRSATPAEPAAYVLRTVDAQARNGADHASDAVEAVRRASPAPSGGGSGTSDDGSGNGESAVGDGSGATGLEGVRERVEAVDTNVFAPLNRALDHLLSVPEGAVPAAVENDKDALVRGLLDHHLAAVDAIESARDVASDGDAGSGGPADAAGGDADARTGDGSLDGGRDAGERDRWLTVAETHLLQLLDLFEHLRTAIAYGDAPLTETAQFTSAEMTASPAPVESDSLVGSLDPDVTIPDAVHARIDAGGTDDDGAQADGGGLRARADPLAPVSWTPTIDRPMFEPLQDLSERHLLPGVADVPRDSIGSLATNPEFVASYMVGLNHEFARELLWRRFPTNRRGTYFRKFWNDTGTPRGEPTPDVTDLTTWTADSLGSAVSTPNVVVVIRGELLRRYPNTTVYLARAKWTSEGRRIARIGADTRARSSEAGTSSTGDGDEKAVVKFPIFQEQLDPDVTFLGFDLTPTAAVGGDLPAENPSERIRNMPPADRPDPGWFVVFEEPMGETKFGLDQGTPADAGNPPMGVKPGTESTVPVTPGQGEELGWNGLSWHHVAGGDPSTLDYLRVWNSPPGGNQTPSDDAFDQGDTWRITDSQMQTEISPKIGRLKPDAESLEAVWGRNSAHMARITFQRPVRVTVHADDLLGRAAASTAWQNGATEGGDG